MTIRISVKNLDSRETAVVAVSCRGTDGEPVPGAPVNELRGGQECLVYVHNQQSLHVEEISSG